MNDSDLALALSRRIFGYARLDPGLKVIDRVGALMDWAPPPGALITESPVFFAMELEFDALREGRRVALDLPGVRLPPEDSTPFSVSVLYAPRPERFLVFVNSDCGALEVERQFAQERREALLLADQAAAAGRLIREQAALYCDIVESANDLVFRLSTDLRVTFVNAFACAVLREDERFLLGRAIDDVLGHSPQDGWRALLGPADDASFEQELQLPGGASVWIWWSVHWVGDKNGPGEFQALGRDVTDLRRLRAEAARGADEARRAAVMRERLRIAHDLHDTLVQSLVALAPQLRLIRKVAGPDASPRLLEELTHADTAVRDGLARARAALSDLRGQTVESQGLGAALEALAARFSSRTGVHTLAEIDEHARPVSGAAAAALYRIAEEALRNVELHANARGVSLRLSADPSRAVALIVADDGQGFEPVEVQPGHFGLMGMREQADMIGASFDLRAEKGGGVRIEVTLPGPRSAGTETPFSHKS
ncbi:histidine kinase [Rhodoblastus acidophilus]|uniref:histidine kinase n=1 Tax=Candidatus Rhodoblastus alkanivorans TaxID=2954117 RepID=A0ABS9Z799_9HYPH|nr:histidine kinase [Candidatus Rhodoblastus alkanivorans]MCI4679565.1 histidine kinase [Candidatus Rhodoblastus alkanivorans]MCI4683316.1 histidine kinase [Candidatus Rhodoblastus alkanivorans]MDI4640629.1 histidine kinase [Rhodoblastus acidophilus]